MLGGQTQIVLPSRLHARDAALHLDRYRVHVAEAPFERIALEDRRRASLEKQHIDRFLGCFDLVRAGLTELDPQGEADQARRRAYIAAADIYSCEVKAIGSDPKEPVRISHVIYF